jgi:hypothetical protein
MNTGSSIFKHYLGKKYKNDKAFSPKLVCKYFRIEFQLVNKIGIFCVRYLKEKRADWYFRATIPNAQVRFFTLNKHNELVIIDDKNNLYHYHCSHQVCLRHHTFYSEEALTIQANEAFLYLLSDDDRDRFPEGEEPEDFDPRKNTLYKYDYHKGKIISETRVDDCYERVSNDFQQDDPWGYCLKNNTLYLSCTDYTHGKKDYPGLAIINCQKKQARITEVCFNKPIASDFHPEPLVYISKHYNLGIRPSYKAPEMVKPQDGSQPYFPYIIEIFDLTSGQHIHQVELYKQTRGQLEQLKEGLSNTLLKAAEAYKHYEKQMLRIAQGAKLSQPEYPYRGYQKAFKKFYQRLQSIIFFPQLSLETQNHLQLEKKCIGFIAKFENEYLKVVINKEGIKISTLGPVEKDHLDKLHNESSPNQNTIRRWYRSESADLLETSTSGFKFIPPEALVINIIEIKKWDLNNAKHALKQYLTLLETNLDALTIEDMINIHVRIGYNPISKQYHGKMDTLALFERLKEFKQDVAPELVALIEWFCQQPKSESLYHDYEANFLIYAMQHLLSLGEQYQPLYLRYLAAVDMDHDVMNFDMCSEILAGDNWTENKLKFLIAMNSLGGQHLYNELFERWPGALEKFARKHYSLSQLVELLTTEFNQYLPFTLEELEESHPESQNDTLLIAAYRHIIKEKMDSRQPHATLS